MSDLAWAFVIIIVLLAFEVVALVNDFRRHRVWLAGVCFAIAILGLTYHAAEAHKLHKTIDALLHKNRELESELRRVWELELERLRNEIGRSPDSPGLP